MRRTFTLLSIVSSVAMFDAQNFLTYEFACPTWTLLGEIFPRRTVSLFKWLDFACKNCVTYKPSSFLLVNAARPTWTSCKIYMGRSFSLKQNSRLRGFLLKWLIFACENSLKNYICDQTFTDTLKTYDFPRILAKFHRQKRSSVDSVVMY